MIPKFGQLRQWRVLYSLTPNRWMADFDRDGRPRLHRQDVLAMSVDEAAALVRLNASVIVQVPGYPESTATAIVRAVKPWVCLGGDR